jgi:hypothetical protein
VINDKLRIYGRHSRFLDTGAQTDCTGGSRMVWNSITDGQKPVVFQIEAIVAKCPKTI